MVFCGVVDFLRLTTALLVDFLAVDLGSAEYLAGDGVDGLTGERTTAWTRERGIEHPVDNKMSYQNITKI